MPYFSGLGISDNVVSNVFEPKPELLSVLKIIKRRYGLTHEQALHKPTPNKCNFFSTNSNVKSTMMYQQIESHFYEL